MRSRLSCGPANPTNSLLMPMPRCCPQDLLKSQLLLMEPYQVPRPGGVLRLDAMENPWGWPPALRRQWAEELAQVDVNRYPDASLVELDGAMRKLMDIPETLATLYGNGSDELIQLLLMGLRHNGRGVMAPEPGFAMYRQLSLCLDLPFRGIPLGPDFQIDADALCTAMDVDNPAILFIASPNNPTGTEFPRSRLVSIIERAPGLVVLDEAYYPYAEDSLLDVMHDFPHMLILRTASKLGLAGLRLGVLIGSPDWVRELEKLRLPYNIGSLNQFSLCFVAHHLPVLQQQIERLKVLRDKLFEDMRRLDTIQVWPSAANFLLFRTLSHPAAQVYQQLLEAGILIRKLHGNHPQLDNCLRVSIGTESENARFLSTLARLVQA